MMLDPQTEELLLVLAVAIGVILFARHRDKRLGARGTQPDDAPRHPTPAALLKRPVLQGSSGYYAGAVIPFDDTEWVLGSDSNVANLVFPDSVPGIAKRHCTLRFDPSSGCVLLEDTWSETGTWLADGTRLAPGAAHKLPIGGQFYAGSPDQMFTIAAG
ncbi:MAG: FHA domain-containing protein [Bryobacterales bacterium]|nr:FHA domain-containing protein [Bryobacterales bacterium]